MNKILNIYKPIGMTPLELITNLRLVYPQYKDNKITYAGRLDPMAHGVMILLIDDAINKKDEYLNLEKEYIFEALFGIETDTYDILGLITNVYLPEINNTYIQDKVLSYIEKLPKKFIQTYPPYSSKTVNGKSLHWWSRQNKLSEITMPNRQVEIKKIELISNSEIYINNLSNLIENRIKLVTGDFRQNKILETWKETLINSKRKKFITLKFKINCSSGLYIRSLVHTLGTSLGTGAVALEIMRTQVGNFLLFDSVKLTYPYKTGL